MTIDPDSNEVAAALRVSIGLFLRRIRQAQAEGELTLPEMSAMARIDRGGPTTSSELAKAEQISPQSMGATLGALEARGLIGRRPDPEDGRRAVITLTKEGQQALSDRRNAGTEQIAQALSKSFTPAELKQFMAVAPLIERLAQSF